MTIAAHITSDNRRQKSFLAKYLTELAAKNPDDHFIFFTGKSYPANAFSPKNITQVSISPKIKNSLLLHYWYNFKLPALLKRYNASVFISENGVLGQRTTVKQIMVLQNIGSIKTGTAQTKFKRYLHKYFPVFIKSADTIICTEKYLETELISKFSSAINKTVTIYPGLDTKCKPISWQQKEEVIKAYADDRDFFLYPVSYLTEKNIVTALKAFSQIKKWQKSTMKLLLLSAEEQTSVKGFDLYKYRDDVKIITVKDKAIAARIIAAAYALIFLPDEDDIAYDCLHAMQAEVPVITTISTLNKSMYEDAALYSNLNEKDIAEKMMRLYKDEHLRNEQIKKGLLQIAKYNGSNTISAFWQVITKVDEE